MLKLEKRAILRTNSQETDVTNASFANKDLTQPQLLEEVTFGDSKNQITIHRLKNEELREMMSEYRDDIIDRQALVNIQHD